MTTSRQPTAERPAGRPKKPARGKGQAPPAAEEAAGVPAVSVFEALRPVEVIDVVLTLPSQTAQLVLAERDEPRRRFSIPIGLPEATAIAYALRGIETPKPLTHELFSNTLALLGAEVAVARLTGKEGGSFYAEIVVSSPAGLREVACRPSDAVCLALRQRPPAPIVAAAGLLDGETAAPRS